MHTSHLHKISAGTIKIGKKQLGTVVLFLCCTMSTSIVQAQSTDDIIEQDRDKIFAALDNYIKGWMNKDADSLAQDYSHYIHWVTPEGKLIYTKDKLEAYFAETFQANPDSDPPLPSLSHQITYLDEKMGIVQTMESAEGEKKYHLRVFYKEGDAWKIMNHLSSQSYPY